MKESKIEASSQLRHLSVFPRIQVQTVGAFNIIGVISALLYSSIVIFKALRLSTAENRTWTLQLSAWRKGHLHASLKRKAQPLRSQGRCGS